MSWTQVVEFQELQEKNRFVYRVGSHQIVLFLVEDEIYAIDNRCPHEGYPLREGTTSKGEKNCTLTCQWHNWKFDLKTGEALKGDDHVRTYQTKVEKGLIWLDLAPPSKEKEQASILEGLKTGIEKRQYGRIARELTRLKVAEINPEIALQKAIEWSYDRFEYGMTHAYAVTADWLMLSRREKENPEYQLLALTEAIDHISHDVLRHPKFPYTERIADFDHESFLQAVENQNEEQAIALFRGALKQGLTWKDLEKSFVHAALAHYNGFGHSLIFVEKASELIQALGSQMTLLLGLPLLRSICFATREDLIPEFSSYQDQLKKYPSRQAQSSESHVEIKELLGKAIKGSMEWTTRLAQKHSAEELFEALLFANAKSLLYYDTSYQDDFRKAVKDNVGWLNLTHALTFASAVLLFCRKYPECWPSGLLQMACFYGRNSKYTDLSQDLTSWQVSHKQQDEFFNTAEEKILDHGIAPPIFSSHLLKTYLSIRLGLKEAPEETQIFLRAGLNRLLHSPIKQKHTRRTIRQAFALIVPEQLKNIPQ